MRIASLAPSATIMLQELGVAHAIVACTHLCPLPLAVRQKLAVGSFSVLNEEKLAATKPDLVITATLVQAKGQERLKAAGYNVLHLDPGRLTDIAENYAQVGAVVRKPAEGNKLRDSFLKEFYGLRVTDHGLRVYMEEWHEPPFVSGNWVPDVVALAGGRSVLIKPGQRSREITLDELLASDPDLIVQHVCLPPGHDWTLRRQQLAHALRQRPGWHQLRAVQQGRVIPLDDTPFNMPTRQVIEGAALLRKVFETVPAAGSPV